MVESTQGLISEVIDAQREAFLKKDIGIERYVLSEIKIHENFVNVITGIRRCGKSTFLLQLLKSYLAFEALRFFKKKQATIVTMEQRDRFEKDGLVVEVVPADEFFMQ